jgi:hypothetical protein
MRCSSVFRMDDDCRMILGPSGAIKEPTFATFPDFRRLPGNPDPNRSGSPEISTGSQESQRDPRGSLPKNGQDM